MGDGTDKKPQPPAPKTSDPVGTNGVQPQGQLGGNAIAAADAQQAEATRKATRAAVHSALIRVTNKREAEELHDLLMNSAPSELETAALDERLTKLDGMKSGDWGVVSVIRLEIAVAGLPSELSEEGGSIGTDLFIDRWTDAITDYLLVEADKEPESFTALYTRVEIDAARFGSEPAILWGELTDAINRLVAAREELRKFAPVEGMDNRARRREIGGEINRLARHILMLDRALSDPRLQHKIDPKAPLESQLDAVRGEISAIRTAEKDDATPGGKTGEQKTQARLGATSSLLAVKSVGWNTQIDPEEAFPDTSDRAAEQWVTDLVARMEETAANVKQARAALVPDQTPGDFDAYKKVFDHWFAFLPVKALTGDPWVSEELSAWREISQQLVGLGWEGWMANQLLKPVGWFRYAALVQPQTGDPLPAAHEYAVTSSDVIPKYSVVSQFVRGSFGMTTQAGARQELIEAGVSKSEADFTHIKAVKKEEQDATALSLGVEQAGHPMVALSEPAKDEWNWLVSYDSPVTEDYKVSEHKSVDKQLLDFEAAGAQLYSMLSNTHTPRAPSGAPIGEAAIRKGGIEAAEGTSRAKYGLDENPTSPRIQAGLARMAQLKAELKPLTSQEQLIRDLERVMDDAFRANESPVFKIHAILYMAWREHDVPGKILEYLDPVVLAKAVWDALKVQALLLALSQLGPIGRLFAKFIGKILHKMGGSDLGRALALFSWFQDAWNTSSFNGARAQSMFAYDNIDTLLNMLHGLVAGKLSELGVKLGLAGAKRWAPKTSKAITDFFKNTFDADDLVEPRDEARQKAEELAKQKGADDPEAKLYKAVADELDGKPTEPQPVEPTPLAKQVEEAGNAAQKAGAKPADVEAAKTKAREDKHAQLKDTAEKALGEPKPGETKPVVEVVPKDQLGHDLSAAKVELDEHGKVKKILVSEDATAAQVAEEVRHAKQSQDPRFKEKFEKVQKVSKDYKAAKPQDKLDAHKAAVDIEIADKKALLDELHAQKEGTVDPDEIVRAYEDLNNLRERQLELAELRARDLADDKIADSLGSPAELHAKKTKPKLKFDPAWSNGTLGEFRAQFEAANPGNFLTMGELDKLWGRTRAENNPNRVMPSIDKFDVLAKQGNTKELDLDGKKREKTDPKGGSLVVSDPERAKLDDLLKKRDNARRERNKALDDGNEAAAKRESRKVRDASRDLGEQALDMWARQLAWEDGAKPSREYKGQTSKSGDFDAVHKWKEKDGTQMYLVGEGKGGTADLGGKWIGGQYVQQGSREYFIAICEKMQKSSDPNARRAGDNLLSVLKTGKDLDGNKAAIIYDKVQVPVDLEEAPKMKTKERSTIDRFLVTRLDVK